MIHDPQRGDQERVQAVLCDYEQSIDGDEVLAEIEGERGFEVRGMTASQLLRDCGKEDVSLEQRNSKQTGGLPRSLPVYRYEMWFYLIGVTHTYPQYLKSVVWPHGREGISEAARQGSQGKVDSFDEEGREHEGTYRRHQEET